MRALSWTAAALALAAVTASAAEPVAAPDHAAAFARVKALAGTWRGTAMAKDGPPATVSYELVSNGTAVLERLFAGTPHEMLNLYHLDAGALVAVHYCAMGNQPRFKYDRAASTATELFFDFAGGTNVDAARDPHVHAGRLFVAEPDRLEEEWTFWKDGKQGDKARLFLSRAPAPRD
jgi:hypothetical protein